MDRRILAKYLDFANHHSNATPVEIKDLCWKVKKMGFHTAFVNPCFVSLAKKLLPAGVVGTVVSFPLGQDAKDVKIISTIKAIRDGADELDISLNVGLFKAGQEREVLEEMEDLVEAAKGIKKSTVVKFIIETGWLNDQEIKKAAELVLKSGADFVKTSSGFGPRGASLKDVKLIREAVGNQIKIKVAGGIDTFKEAVDFIEAGANRIGTSRAPEIINQV